MSTYRPGRPLVLVLLASVLLAVSPTAVSRAEATSVSPPTTPLLAGTSVPGAGSAGVVSGTELPLVFEANKGQAGRSARFVSRQPGAAVAFEKDRLRLALTLPDTRTSISEGARSVTGSIRDVGMEGALQRGLNTVGATGRSLVGELRFVGAQQSARVVGGERAPGVVNYMIGSDRFRWRTGVQTYSGLVYQGLYPGVDLAFDGGSGQLKGTYTVAPGADPKQIRWRYTGSTETAVDEDGNLNATLGTGESAVTVTEHAPVAWQTEHGRRVDVPARFAVAPDNTIRFELGRYDSSRELTIDPMITYSTYHGGGGGGSFGDEDEVMNVAVDAGRNAYVSGNTCSPGFPTTEGAYQREPRGERTCSAFVSKFSPDGELVYSTLIGGSRTRYIDRGYAIAVDAEGSAYLAGLTAKEDFPTTENAFQRQKPGGFDPDAGIDVDAFVVKFTPDGSDLVYSTYLGGSISTSDDWHFTAARDIAVDRGGVVYVTGRTSETDFPTTSDAFQSSLNSSAQDFADGFVAKFTPDGNALEYSTFLGGTGGGDEATSVAVEGSGAFYVAGHTNGGDFPTTPGAFQFGKPSGNTSSRSDADAFVTKFSSDGRHLVYSTYLGGTAGDGDTKIAVDAQRNAYVVGLTLSNDFPTTAGSFQASDPSPDSTSIQDADVFVAKLAPGGDRLVYSTYLGGSSTERLPISYGSIAVDEAGAVFLTGHTLSDDFPMVDPIQSDHEGAVRTFVTKVHPTGSRLDFSTYLAADIGRAVAIDHVGGVWVVGVTGYTGSEMPTTSDANQPGKLRGGGYGSGFVVRLALQALPNLVPADVQARHGESGRTVLTAAVANKPVVLRKAVRHEQTLFDETKIDLTPGTYLTGEETVEFPFTVPAGMDQIKVELTDVNRTPAASVAPGDYDLRVVDPDGKVAATSASRPCYCVFISIPPGGEVLDANQETAFVVGPKPGSWKAVAVKHLVPPQGNLRLTVTGTSFTFEDVDSQGADAHDVVLRFLDGDTVIAESSPIDIPLGQTVEVSVPWETSGASGEREISVVVDPENRIVESKESDNALRRMVTVGGT